MKSINVTELLLSEPTRRTSSGAQVGDAKGVGRGNGRGYTLAPSRRVFSLKAFYLKQILSQCPSNALNRANFNDCGFMRYLAHCLLFGLTDFKTMKKIIEIRWQSFRLKRFTVRACAY